MEYESAAHSRLVRGLGTLSFPEVAHVFFHGIQILVSSLDGIPPLRNGQMVILWISHDGLLDNACGRQEKQESSDFESDGCDSSQP